MMMVLSKVKICHYRNSIPVVARSNSIAAGSLQEFYPIDAGSLQESLTRFSDQTTRSIEKIKYGFCLEYPQLCNPKIFFQNTHG